jgi:HlyD family secretion protein
MVSVTGKLEPAIWSSIGSETGGKITALDVQAGDQIEAGDVLFQFDSTEAELAVAQAEDALEVARAELVRLKGPALQERLDVAEAQVAAARASVTQTLAQRDRLWAVGNEAELAAADARIAAARAEQLIARQEHDDMMKCHEVQQPDGTKKKICPTLGTYEERARFVLNAANQELTAAEAHQEAVASEYWAQIEIAEAAVTAAKRQRDVAEAQLVLSGVGPQDEELAVAQARVDQAESNLDAARTRLERTRIRAPFDGTVGWVGFRVGESVTPGAPIVILGDLSTLHIKTTDLDEIDVTRVTLGQEVTVTFDALADQTFTGSLVDIAPMAEPEGGGVSYTAIIELPEIDPALRWGMTAFVDIEVQ